MENAEIFIYLDASDVSFASTGIWAITVKKSGNKPE